MYTLYVIPGSHACRSAMLMLEYKRAPYRRVEFVTLTHATLARVAGFNAGGETRAAGGKRTPGLWLADHLGTVPGLADGKQRISTNHAIARYLDQRHPDPPLLPADPERRAQVEAAEAWANETLQMNARRILFAAVARDPIAYACSTADGRLGPLLYRHELARRLIAPWIGRLVFATTPGQDAELLADLSAMLDRIDAWIGDGVLGGGEPNAADLMVAPSLALILYRGDVLPRFEGRPALELVDRLLPEPIARTTPVPASAARAGS
jgi:glutathione S-transferase